LGKKVAISKSHPTAVNNIPKFIQNHTATVIYINQFIQKRTLCEYKTKNIRKTS